MGSSTRIIRAALLAAAAAALVFAAFQLREKHQEAEDVVQNIHDELDALDPATRAAVVARLTSDEVKKVRGDEQALAVELAGYRPVPFAGVAARVAARRW